MLTLFQALCYTAHFHLHYFSKFIKSMNLVKSMILVNLIKSMNEFVDVLISIDKELQVANLLKIKYDSKGCALSMPALSLYAPRISS